MLLLLLSFSSLTSISSQDKSCKSFDVYENGRKLKNPFSGGLNAPQFNQMDINQDGFEDIIVFERSTGQLSIYLYENGQYIFTCDYNEVFPAVNSWMFLSDYNGDGLKDLFTSPKYSSSPHIELWKACKTPDGICFEKLRFPYGTGDILSYYYPGNYFGVYVAKPDFPAIVDVDHDGDLDILSFEPGGGTVNWYKNISVESGISPDSFKLVLQDRCWAKFRESPFDETILLSDNPENCADWSGNFRHAESTINLLDMDGDLDYDIILGDSEFDGLIYIENGKITSDWGTKIIRPFPEGENQVKLRWFLGSYNIDVDLDGKPDLVVAPNAQYGAGNKDNVFFLRDIGIPPKKDFEIRQKNFLQDEMIDWGSQIYPVLTDYDRDGLVDLILGTSGLIGNNGDISPKIVYYRNTGTRHQPEFSLMTDNMFSANTLGYKVLVPAIGDLDGDGDDDLIIGTEDGNLIYFENLAGPGK